MVSALAFRLSGLGFKPWPGALTVLCSWARHFTVTVPLTIAAWVIGKVDNAPNG